MNTPESPRDIEVDIRRLFAPDHADVARLLARVSIAPTRRNRWSGYRLWPAVVLGMLAMGVAWQSWRGRPARVDDSALTISGDREVVVVERAADGRRWAVAAARDGVPVGNYVIVLGR